jgi:hypothetical protein
MGLPGLEFYVNGYLPGDGGLEERLHPNFIGDRDEFVLVIVEQDNLTPIEILDKVEVVHVTGKGSWKCHSGIDV